MAARSPDVVLTTALQAFFAAVTGRQPHLRKLRMSNNDTIPHTFVIADGATAKKTWTVAAGVSQEVVFDRNGDDFGWVFSAGNAAQMKLGEALNVAGSCVAQLDAGKL